MQFKKNQYRHFAWIALAYMVIWLALYAFSFVYPVNVYANRAIEPGFILMGAMAALVLSYLQWIAVWLVFGPRPYLLRIVLSLIASVVGLGVFWGAIIVSTIEWGGGEYYSPPNPDFFEMFSFSFSVIPFCLLLVQLPSGLVRWALGWQINRDGMPAEKRSLSISDLLIVTSLIAAAVASLSWTGITEVELIGWVILWSVMLLLFVLPIVYLTMMPRSEKGRTSITKNLLISICGLLSIGGVLFLGYLMPHVSVSGVFPPALCFLSVFVVSLLASFCLSRRVGYRLWTDSSKRACFLDNVNQDEAENVESVVAVDPFQ